MESQVGYPPSVYFSVGRACPDHGQAALAFGSECEQGRAHSATPFGTGGVVKQDQGSAFRLNIQPDGLPERIAYCRARTIPADRDSGWRSGFARWFAAYYPSDPAGYWIRPPENPDPEDLYRLNDDWQAWTWEVRFHRGPRVLDAGRWAADSAHLNDLRQ